MDKIIEELYPFNLPLCIKYMICEYCDILPLTIITIDYKLRLNIRFLNNYKTNQVSSLMSNHLRMLSYGNKMKWIDEKDYKFVVDINKIPKQ
jgi:hypothetical protein